jgi:hypothetical protein
VTSAQAISNSRIRISFSEPVEISGSPFMALRYVDANNDVQVDPFGGGTPLQWDGTWAYEDASHTSIIWTINPGHNMSLATILGFSGSWAGVIDLTQYASTLSCKFVIEENSSVAPGVKDSKVINVTSAGGDVLAATNLTSAGTDGSYTSVAAYDPTLRFRALRLSAVRRFWFPSPSLSPFPARPLWRLDTWTRTTLCSLIPTPAELRCSGTAPGPIRTQATRASSGPSTPAITCL